MCWIIPLIVGLISALLGYLLGKRCIEKSPLFIDLRNENENLKRKLKLCEEQKVAGSATAVGFSSNQGAKIETISNSEIESHKHYQDLMSKYQQVQKELAQQTVKENPAPLADKANNNTVAFSSNKEDYKDNFDAALAKSILGKRVKQDDLTLIEGIGPKISQLFHDANIKTWYDLANTSTEHCREILDNGGRRFAIHNPKTWSKQARLAAEGKWQELSDWQDELKGGREV